MEQEPLRIGIDPSLSSWAPEIKYVFRTLLRIAGFPYAFVWANEPQAAGSLDIYYGPVEPGESVPVGIVSSGKAFTSAPYIEPEGFIEHQDIPFLDFGDSAHSAQLEPQCLRFTYDIIFACYWLLTGARESQYARDRLDNIILEGSSILEKSVLSRPLVSIYGRMLRDHFQRLGYPALDFPWISGDSRAAFVLTHDVDYPQIIRGIECLRLLKARGRRALREIRRVLNGESHFWKFQEWVEFAKEFGTRPTFYFMARQGSLLQYALGTPDSFYDIRAPEFRQLFRYLRDEGCEIGLHASYNAYRCVEQLRSEREKLEEAAGVEVLGNRHHYWHLDPTAPHETLSRLAQAGLAYDSSLGYDFYPGFRRGICHPFRPFHPGERKELPLVELPPTWMDDHFDRRLVHNGIRSSSQYARQLIEMAEVTQGIIVLDYHVRGMNSDIYPHYGLWLHRFIRALQRTSLTFQNSRDLVQQYLKYEKHLEIRSNDDTERRAMIEADAYAT